MNRQIEIFRKVNDLAELNYNNEQTNHTDFLSACHKSLAQYFKGYFKDEFIFSALSFSKNNELHYVDEKIDNGYIFNETYVKNWQRLSKLLHNYIDEVKKNEIISITKILLDKNNKALRKDLFFTCSPNCKYQYGVVSDYGVKCNKVFQYEMENFKINDKEYYIANRGQLDNFYNEFSSGSYEQSKSLYDRYIWDYHKFANEYKKENNKSEFLLHFIKPSVVESNYGLLLSLATNRHLTSDELTFVNLILYRVVNQTAFEKSKEDMLREEEINQLKNISATSHVIKTTINGLFGPPLNSLLQDSTDPRIKEIQLAKEKVFNYAEVINLITKLSSVKLDKKEIQAVLEKSNLFTTNTEKVPELESLLESIISYRNIDPNNVKLNYTFKKSNMKFSKKVFKFNQYYLSESFYELLLLTIIENIVLHGATNKNGELSFTIKTSMNEILFENISKPNQKEKLSSEDMTGNFRVFDTIFSKLKIGEFSVKINNDKNKFTIILKANKDE